MPADAASFGEPPAPDSQDTRFRWVRLRSADAQDAEQIAALHAESWRRHYRGAYADSLLDGDVAADRRRVCSARPGSTAVRAGYVWRGRTSDG